MSKVSYSLIQLPDSVGNAISLEAERRGLTLHELVESIMLEHVVSTSTIFGGMIGEMRDGIRNLNVGCEGTLRDFIGENWKIIPKSDRRVFADYVQHEIQIGRLDWIADTGRTTGKKQHRLYRIIRHPPRMPTLSDNPWW